MNVSVISSIIVFLVVAGLGETENSVKLDREKRMTTNRNIFNSFLNLVDNVGSSLASGGNNNQNGGYNRPNGGNNQNGGYNRPNGGNNNQNGGYNRPNGGNNQNGGYNRPNGGNNRPNNGIVLQRCSPNNKCGKGYGDCETDQDCGWGLFCGKNNCKGEFGARAPDGSFWENKDDCCTDNAYYCNPKDRIPSSRRTCCSPSNPCPFSHGDCDTDADCQSGLKCGDNNCKDFHTGAGNKDDCCTYRDNGGNRPPNGGNRPNGGSQPNGGLQQCSPNNQCGLGRGDCETDQDCQSGLFCGKNNCKGEFGGRAPDGSLWSEKDDCCTNNIHYCNQLNVFPWWRRTCCGPNNPCPFQHGDCDKDEDCVSNLVCGDNNCRDFHRNAGNKDDCCTYPDYKKKRSVEGKEISNLAEDEASKLFNETIDDASRPQEDDASTETIDNASSPSEDDASKPVTETIDYASSPPEDDASKPFTEIIDDASSPQEDEVRNSEKLDREKRMTNNRNVFNSFLNVIDNFGSNLASGGNNHQNGGYNRPNGGNYNQNGGYNRPNGGNYNQNGGYNRPNGGNYNQNGGYNRPNGGNYNQNGGYNRPNGGNNYQNGGYNRPNGGHNRPNNQPNNGYRPNNGGFSSSYGGSRPNNGGNRPINGGNRPINGGNRPINGGNRPINGGNRPLSGCEAEPSFRCCTPQRPCSLGGGDCTGDSDCQGGLVCGSNNCRKFHPNADKKMDCCAFKKIK